MARLLSLNLGLPRDIAWKCKTVHTDIWREPVHGRPILQWLNSDGDSRNQQRRQVYRARSAHRYQAPLPKATATRAGAVGA